MEEFAAEALLLELEGGILTVAASAPAPAPAPASPQKTHFLLLLLLLHDLRCWEHPLLAAVPLIRLELLVGMEMELPAARAAPPRDPDRQGYSLFPSSRSRNRTRYNMHLFPAEGCACIVQHEEKGSNHPPKKAIDQIKLQSHDSAAVVSFFVGLNSSRPGCI